MISTARGLADAGTAGHAGSLLITGHSYPVDGQKKALLGDMSKRMTDLGDLTSHRRERHV